MNPVYVNKLLFILTYMTTASTIFIIISSTTQSFWPFVYWALKF